MVSFQSAGPYYFIALIVQYYLLPPFLKRFVSITGLVISATISISMLGIIFYFRYYTEIELPLIIYAGNFATWVVFFILGLLLGSSLKIKISNKLLVVLIFMFYVLSCVESYILISMYHQAGSAVSAVRVFSFMYSFFLIVFLFKNHNLIRSSILKKIGEISFGIYLIHGFAIKGGGVLLSILHPSLQENAFVYQFTLIGIVIFLCILLFNNLFSLRKSKLVGFK